MIEAELKKYYETCTACRKLFRKYADPVDTDEFWDDLRLDANAVYREDPTEFRKKMVLDTLEEIDRIAKNSSV